MLSPRLFICKKWPLPTSLILLKLWLSTFTDGMTQHFLVIYRELFLSFTICSQILLPFKRFQKNNISIHDFFKMSVICCLSGSRRCSTCCWENGFTMEVLFCIHSWKLWQCDYIESQYHINIQSHSWCRWCRASWGDWCYFEPSDFETCF